MNLKKSLKFFLKSLSHVQHTIFISAGSPYHTLVTVHNDISSIHHYFIFFMTTKSIGQPKV